MILSDKTKSGNNASATSLHYGYFNISEKTALPWQSCRPGAKYGHKTRGTIILLNDFGTSFTANPGLLKALAARHFACVSYSWYLKAQTINAADGKKVKKQKPIYACHSDKTALSHFLKNIVLPDYPAPFYLLAQGAGALFALNTQDLFTSFLNRMVTIMPVFSINDQKSGSFYKFTLKLLKTFSSSAYPTPKSAQKSYAYQADLLNQSATVLSPNSYKIMHLPCLIISTTTGKKINHNKTLMLVKKLRLADIITIPDIATDFLCDKQITAQKKQFWAAFDAFIPGSDTTSVNNHLEHPVLL